MTRTRIGLQIAALGAALAAPAAAEDLHVIDGDGIRIGGIDYRLTLDHPDRSFDAPELNGGCPAERMLARAARDRLAALLADGFDGPVPNGERIRGWNGTTRIVAMVSVGGENVGAILIREHFAVPTERKGRSFTKGVWCADRGAP